MEFLSEEWVRALDEAARSRVVPDGEPRAAATLTIDQRIVDGPTYRLRFEGGALSVEWEPTGEPDVWMRTDRATAAAIARGERPALDAFIHGDLALHGDTAQLLEHRDLLETLGDLFGAVKAATIFPT